MAGEIFIARQDTLESVKSDTQKIVENTKKNYNSISGSIKTTLTSTWAEILNITGKGYITQLTGYTDTESYGNYGMIFSGAMRIKIDNVVIYEGKISGATLDLGSVGIQANYGGFLLRDYLGYRSGDTGSQGYGYFFSPTAMTKRQVFNSNSQPFIDAQLSGNAALMIGTHPLYFNTSVVVEVKNINTKVSYVEYFGGVEIA